MSFVEFKTQMASVKNDELNYYYIYIHSVDFSITSTNKITVEYITESK